MSYRSLSVNIQAAFQLCNTQRKIDTLHTKSKDKNANKKFSQLKGKKSHPKNYHPPKPNSKHPILKSMVSQTKPLLFKSEKMNKKIDKSTRKDNNTQFLHEHPEFQDISIKILKVKKAPKIKVQMGKIERLRQKIGQFCELKNIEAKKQGNQIKYFAKKRQNSDKQRLSNDDLPKKIPSLYLKSTNFEDPTILEDARMQNIKNQNKRFPSFRMLKNLKVNNEQKPVKRKRIQSCRFVINPFKSVDAQNQQKFQYLKSLQEQNQNEIEEFRNKIQMNEISEIENMAKHDDSLIQSMNVSILGLMNW